MYAFLPRATGYGQVKPARRYRATSYGPSRPVSSRTMAAPGAAPAMEVVADGAEGWPLAMTMLAQWRNAKGSGPAFGENGGKVRFVYGEELDTQLKRYSWRTTCASTTRAVRASACCRSSACGMAARSARSGRRLRRRTARRSSTSATPCTTCADSTSRSWRPWTGRTQPAPRAARARAARRTLTRAAGSTRSMRCARR